MTLMRREPTRTPGGPAARASKDHTPPEFGSFKARRRWRHSHGIRPVGPQVSSPEPPLGVVEAGMLNSAAFIDEYRETIKAELTAIDRRREAIAQTSGRPGRRREFAQARRAPRREYAARDAPA